ncbi:hypothetical protein ACGIF2_14675 [Cellulomonas sp. P22]|uniref:hypothetical protein n=1 Tax=Cellulomonas sp. P22 TaxID=3373189 RepID=UPI00378BDC5F
MSRSVLGWDRAVACVLGIVLLVAGLLAIAWWGGYLDSWWTPPDQLATGGAADQVDQSWWPWAAGVLGLLLVLLGLRWLWGHVPRRGAGPLRLEGSSPSGALSIDANEATRAAADVLAGTPGVRSASGSFIRDRGELVAGLVVTVDPTADLDGVGSAIEVASADLHRVLGRDDVHLRAQVHVAKDEQRGSRVT